MSRCSCRAGWDVRRSRSSWTARRQRPRSKTSSWNLFMAVRSRPARVPTSIAAFPPVPRRGPPARQLLPLQEVLHDVQELVVGKVALELVDAALVRLVRVEVALVLLVGLLGIVLGELVAQLLLVERNRLAGLPRLDHFDLLGQL